MVQIRQKVYSDGWQNGDGQDERGRGEGVCHHEAGDAVVAVEALPKEDLQMSGY